MTNEEFASRIQAGETDLMEDLWEQVAGLVKWKANQAMIAAAGRSGVELDDLVQSGYIALVAALKTYDPKSSSFSNWFMYYLQSAFAQATGYRTEKQRNDPLRSALSLETPVGDDDGDTLGDLRADPNSYAPFDAVEDRIYHKQLRQVLESMVNQLPPQQADTIRRRYFAGHSLEEIANTMGKSPERIRQLEALGLDHLRKPALRDQLDEFLEKRTPYYLHVGASQFQRTHESAVERIVLIRERLKSIAERKIQ